MEPAKYHPAEIHVRDVRSVVCVEMIGRFGLDAADVRLADAVRMKLLEGKRDFVINCASVNFINSLGIGVLIKAYARVMREGGRFKLCDADQRVCNIFSIAFGDSLFSYAGSCADAMRELMDEGEVAAVSEGDGTGYDNLEAL